MTSPRLPDLLERFDAAAGAAPMAWLLDVMIAVGSDRGALHAALAEVDARVPSAALGVEGGWRTDDVARLLLLRACGEALDGLLPAISRSGGPAIRRTLFLALPLLDLGVRRADPLAVV